jgi:hypothetical protein
MDAAIIVLTLSEWPNKWFGIFSGSEESLEGIPDIGSFIDKTWCPKDKSLIMNYLKTSPNVVASSAMPTVCLLCGEMLGDPGSFFSDGFWLWPERLVHYIEKHDLRIPDEMVRYIQEAKYIPPSKLDVDLSDLPWPDC